MNQDEEFDIVELMRARPHLFILGAGATKETIPNGDDGTCLYHNHLGICAPKSDSEAKKMMLKAFSSDYRPHDQIEVTDIANEDTLHKTWLPFAKDTNYHLNIHKSLMDTYLAEFPRRSVEGYVKRNIEGWWGGSTLPLKDCNTFDELALLFKPLLKNEKQNNFSVI